ncbi:hypothetical protein H3V53_34120 [Paraburkholderia bengalensis]|uniref:Uncharacterized protein n=1 Tax=Paraburkholderia bengalensis TaxID=2747562 RepID=A0ABU8J2J3_9BURK
MKTITRVYLTLLCGAVAACGGGNDSSQNSKPVALTGWYNCGTSYADSAGNPTIALFTVSGKMFGTCGGYSTFTAQYSALLPDISLDPNYITATLTNFWFYDTVTNQRAVNVAGKSIPADAYTGTGSASASLVDINFTETGPASKAGSIDRFVIPTKLTFGQLGSSAPPVRPASIAGFAGHLGQVLNIPVSVSGNLTTYAWTPQVDFTIDSQGNISASIASGTLTAATKSYDPSTGVAEFTGTFTGASGAVAVSGAFAYFPTPTLAGYPIAMYIAGPTFEYTYRLNVRS